MATSTDGDDEMEIQVNGLVASVYSLGKDWKVAHPVRIGSRFGKSIVATFGTELAALKYARGL